MLNNKENFNLLSSEELIIPVISYEKDLNGNKKSVKSNLSLNEIFSDKKIVIFGLPGAYTPTCSSTHLPRFEQIYDSFKKNGVDEVYCVSVNDPFVMEAWGAKHS